MKVRITALVENLAGGLGIWAEYALSLLIEAGASRVLLDTGESPDLLRHNVVDAFKLQRSPLHAIVLSHGHHDHTRGMPAALDLFPGAPVVAHPALFEKKLAKRDDKVESIGILLTPEEIRQRTTLVLSSEPREVAPGIWTTGEIVERPYETSGGRHLYVEREGKVIPETYTDDMSVVVKTDAGLVAVLGCCHAGLLNTLGHIKKTFGEPIRAVVGGTHLGGISDGRIESLAQTLVSEYGTPKLYLNHCTGTEVVVKLAIRLGKKRSRYLACGDTIEV